MKRKLLTTLLGIGGLAFLAAPLSADDINVERIWTMQCKKCHGTTGNGKTRIGAKLGVRDYTDPKVQAMFTDEEAIKITLEGATKDGEEVMKGFKDDLTEAEVKALVDYIRTMDDSS